MFLFIVFLRLLLILISLGLITGLTLGLHHITGFSSEYHGKIPSLYASSRVLTLSFPPIASNPSGSLSAWSVGGKDEVNACSLTQ